MDPEIKKTLSKAGDSLESSLGDAGQEEAATGRWDAGPEGNYEGGLRDNKEDGLSLPGTPRFGTRHAGFIEADGFHREHGNENEYGFVRRPTYKSDIEPN